MYLAIASLLVYGGLLTALSQLWYAGHTTSDFHFFNDWAEWHGMDKAGHFFTAFHISDIGVHLLGLAGFSRRKAIVWGSLAGIMFQTPIEILDGYGIAYGFSWGDVAANLAGSGFLFMQYFLWNEIRLLPKFSFHTTALAPLRPHLLGENLPQQFLKDYNGQTYWLALDLWKFIHPNPKASVFLNKKNDISETQSKKRNAFWLLPSVGLGAENMIFARDAQNLSHGLEPFSQLYFSADVNLESLPAKQRFWQFVLFGLNKLHTLLPALEYSSLQGITAHLWFW